MLTALFCLSLLQGNPMHPSPGPEHARLAPLAGSWDLQISFWTRPEEPPSRSRAFSVIEPLFGGLYLQERVEGLLGEAPFVSLTWYGFDPLTHRYQTARIASTRADRVDEAGSWDEAHQSLVLESVGDGSAPRTRTVLRVLGADSLLVERFVLPPHAAAWRSAEIRYTRRPN